MTLDQWLIVGSIFIPAITTVVVYFLSKKISAKDKYEHEIYISKQLNNVLGRKIILANVKKYNANNDEENDKNYCKQACGLDSIIKNYGIVVSLRDFNDFKLGLVPFDWIEYTRKDDSEDGCYMVVCKFKGIRWYKNFKSPIKEIL